MKITGWVKFCFKINNETLEFHQLETFVAPNGETCFETWYNDGFGNDAYSYAQDWLEGGIDGRSIVLKSNIEFAGKTDNNGTVTCNDAPNAFKGKYLELGQNDVFTSETGKIDTISGTCYESSTDQSMGFIKLGHESSDLNHIDS